TRGLSRALGACTACAYQRAVSRASLSHGRKGRQEEYFKAPDPGRGSRTRPREYPPERRTLRTGRASDRAAHTRARVRRILAHGWARRGTGMARTHRPGTVRTEVR